MSSATESRPPLPPFTRESAVHKVCLAEDAWTSRDPQRGFEDVRRGGPC